MYHINCGKKSGRNTDAATAEYPDNVLLWRPGENGRYYVTDTDFFYFYRRIHYEKQKRLYPC